MTRSWWLACVVLILAACADSGPKPGPTRAATFEGQRQTAALTANPSVGPTQEETRLLARLDRSVQPALAAALRKTLSDQPSVRIHIDGNPAAQAILDSIMVSRAIAATSALQATPAGRPLIDHGTDIADAPVLVVLVDQLSDATATAMILRRRSLEPHDVIVLKESAATSGELGAAMRELANARERMGETPTQNAMTFVHDRRAPSTWASNKSDEYSNSILEAVKRSIPVDVPGVGLGRATRIMMGRRRGKVLR